MERREAPPTEEGWYALHDFRSIRWDEWTAASEREQSSSITDGRAYLADASEVVDAEAGASVLYAVLGHKADILLIHLRPSLAALEQLERAFEQTGLSRFTEQVHSYVSVTEVSGYTSQEFFEEGESEDQGLENYFNMRLYPTIPDAEYVCFYPMNKRRDQEHNWYDLAFEDRAEFMESHGEIGRRYAGKVTQMITGSVGFDDWEWGVTLWANDPAMFKRLLYEMRFDPSTSKFAEFGRFFIGRSLGVDSLGAYLAGEQFGETELSSGEQEESPGDQTKEPSPHGTRPSGDGDSGIREELAELGVYSGQPHGEEVHALGLYSSGDEETVVDEVTGLRSNFEHYDTHVKTSVYTDSGSDRLAVVSLWETAQAAETASGFLSEIPGVIREEGTSEGFGTMGMFYSVKPAYYEEFKDTFSEVTGIIEEMDGHRETRLFENVEDEHDMFISSQWDSKEDAMAFFRSEAFSETVSWGRDVLEERPRHVFLA